MIEQVGYTLSNVYWRTEVEKRKLKIINKFIGNSTPMLRPLFLLLLLYLSISNKSIGQNSPYSFIENKGQWPEEVKYRADIPGGKLFLQSNTLVYLFHDTEKLASKHKLHENVRPNEREAIAIRNDQISMHALKVNFLNSFSKTNIISKGKVNTYYNFFKGNNLNSKAGAFRALEFEEIYKGINYKFYSKGNQLKYDLIVKKGADPSDIKIQYEGALKIFKDHGNIYIETSLNKIIEQKPVAYQIIKNDTIWVTCEFALNDEVVSFAFPKGYNKSHDLVIDPLLIFSTYSGSFADNWGYTATYGERGTLYSGGNVFDAGFPTTIGAFKRNFSGEIDVAIIKYDSIGSNIIWASYLGGSEFEVPHSLLMNNAKDLIILGTTSSSDFPLSTDAFDASFSGGDVVAPVEGVLFRNGCDLYVTRISQDGTTLLSSTYVGGNENDGILDTNGPLTKNYGDEFRGDIIVDQSDNIYVATNTLSTDIPILNGFQNVMGGKNDGYVFKMNKNLSEIIWSTYLGGGLEDAAFSIKLDKSGNVYVAGGTVSNNFPTTTESLHPVYKGGGDGFVASISNDGLSILSSTFLGTEFYDQAYFLDIDSEENIYLLGQTRGAYPVSSGVYSNSKGGQFIHKLNKSLDQTIFSTVIGSSGSIINPNISPTAFLASECENIYIAGWASSINFDNGYIRGTATGLPITNDAVQKTTNGSDFYFMVLSTDAKKLLYGTFFGGSEQFEHVDGGTSRFDKSGIVYHVVCAGCGGQSNFTTTSQAWSRSNNSTNCNMAAFKFDLSSINASFDLPNTVVCEPPYRINIKNNTSGAVNYLWDFGDGTTSTSPNVTFHEYNKPGEYTITLTASNTESCGNNTAIYSQKVNIEISNFFVGEGSTVCEGESFQLTSSGGETYNWTPTEGLSNPNTPSPIATPEKTTWYKVEIRDLKNCVHTDSILVSVIKDVQVEFEYTHNFSCTEPPVFQFTNLSQFGQSFIWDFGDGTTSTDESPSHTFIKDSTYQVRLTGINSNCTESKVIVLPVRQTFVPNAFTPNNDGKNDYFEIKSQEPLKVVIVNRWGKEVYASDEYKNEWNAEGYPNGTYFYSLKSKDGRECKGWVQVLK